MPSETSSPGDISKPVMTYQGKSLMLMQHFGWKLVTDDPDLQDYWQDPDDPTHRIGSAAMPSSIPRYFHSLADIRVLELKLTDLEYVKYIVMLSLACMRHVSADAETRAHILGLSLGLWPDDGTFEDKQKRLRAKLADAVRHVQSTAGA